MSQEETRKPQMFLSFPANYPDTDIAEVLAEFALPESVVEVRKGDLGPFAAFEWTVPTTVVAAVGTAFLVSFATEAGKDVYLKTKVGLKALAARLKGMRTRFVASSGSLHKLSSHYHQSGAFSIVVQAKSGQRVKMLFDELSQADWEDAIEVFLAIAVVNQQQHPNDPLTVAAANLGAKPTAALYAVFNRESKLWEFQDDKTMLAIQHKA